MPPLLSLARQLLKYTGSGPFWYRTQLSQHSCYDDWFGFFILLTYHNNSFIRWAFLLYIQNYYPGTDSACMSWSWYLAVDMQLFVVCTLIVFVIRANRRVGLGLLTFAFIGSTLANIVISDVYHVGFHWGSLLPRDVADTDY